MKILETIKRKFGLVDVKVFNEAVEACNAMESKLKNSIDLYCIEYIDGNIDYIEACCYQICIDCVRFIDNNDKIIYCSNLEWKKIYIKNCIRNP